MDVTNLQDLTVLFRLFSQATGLTPDRLADCLLGGAVLLVGLKALKWTAKGAWFGVKLGGQGLLATGRMLRRQPEPVIEKTLHPLAESILGCLARLQTPLGKPVKILHVGKVDLVLETHHAGAETFERGDILIAGENWRHLLQPHESTRIFDTAEVVADKLVHVAEEAERQRLARVVQGEDVGTDEFNLDIDGDEQVLPDVAAAAAQLANKHNRHKSYLRNSQCGPDCGCTVVKK